MFEIEEAEAASAPYPYGTSGLGQIVPGIKPQTTRIVVGASLGLVVFAFGLWLIMKPKRKPADVGRRTGI